MDAQYFIDKFSAIPDENWIRLQYGDEEKHCVLGHCGVRNNGPVTTDESCALNRVLAVGDLFSAVINDYVTSQFPQATPKERILAALEHIKSLSL